MTNHRKLATFATLAIIAAAVVPLNYWSFKYAVRLVSSPSPVVEKPIEETRPLIAPELLHRRETWLSALEWCESRGRNDAINPEDKDGTASYYSYQFKPKTFRHYGVKYELIPTSTTDAEIMKLMQNYDLMRDIVRHMIDDPAVKWEGEFPDCVLRKVGRPPIK